MYDSKMSGKKKVIKDGKIIFEDEKYLLNNLVHLI